MMRKSFKNTERTSSPDRVVKYAEAAAYKAVRLPYKGCSISAIAVLPSQEVVQKHGLAAAIAELSVEELLDASKYRNVSPLGLELEMPRFTVKNECMSLSSVSKGCLCLCLCSNEGARAALVPLGPPGGSLTNNVG